MFVLKLASVLLVGISSLALAAYPAHYEVGYGFVNHGGVGPHGHYLPAVAQVKVHKDPFHSSYSLDEEGPTHYKYIRQSSVNHHPVPVIHEPIHHDHHHHHLGHGHHHVGHHHHHHAHPVGIAAGVPLPVHGGVIAAAPVGLGYGGVVADYYDGYAGYPHALY